jgi:hypothetical protein
MYSAYTDAATANGKVMEVQEVMCIDLSTPFGLTNEPIATEFSDMLTYAGTPFFNGTRNIVINPNDKYYWVDRSGNNRHLHAVNVAYDTTGGVQAGPPAFWLDDGVNDYLKFDSATDIVVADGSISAFVVFQAKDAVSATHRILRVGDATLSKAAIGIDLTPSVFQIFSEDSGTASTYRTLAEVPVANAWYSLYGHYNSTNNINAISKNGGSLVTGSVLTNGTVATRRIVLATNMGLSSSSNTRVAEVYLFNRVLTQAEIKQLHNNIATRYGLAKV